MISSAEGDQPGGFTHRPAICYCVGIVLIVYLLASVFLVVAVHVNLFGDFGRFQLLRAHVMCGGFGMLGAAMATARKYYQILITESTNRANKKPTPVVIWDLGWSFYYLTRPILGGILGALSYTLSFVGFNALSTMPDVGISKEGHLLLYGLAFVSGYAVSQVLDRLNTIAKQLFQHKPETEGM